MYTRCSECRTIFRISRGHLNAARGKVRCGHCGTTFDALESLREELPDETMDLLDADPEQLSQPEVPAAEFPDLAAALEPTDTTTMRRWPWTLASAVLALTLAAQAVHMYRGELAEHDHFGPWLYQVYEWAGLELVPSDPPVELSAFALLHHEMISHPRLADGLHLSGVLVNDAGIDQPWPLLELRLEDRFGDTVAARRLAPEEYLRNATQRDSMMPAGARRAIEIELLDPGRDAIGFSIDFCVELRAGLRCASDERLR